MIYESDIEKRLLTALKRIYPNVWVLKMRNRHWPDRMIVIGPRIWFVELKRPDDNRVTRGQQSMVRRLNQSGTPALISESVEEILEWIRETLE